LAHPQVFIPLFFDLPPCCHNNGCARFIFSSYQGCLNALAYSVFTTNSDREKQLSWTPILTALMSQRHTHERIHKQEF